MTQSITLTAQQAAELHTTGRTGYREKCEWQPPTPVVTIVWEGRGGKHFVEWKKERFFKNRKWRHELTPPRDTDTAYAVKEPCELASSDSNRFFVCYDGGAYDEKTGAEWHETTPDDEWKQQLTEYGTWYIRDAEEMPDWAVRQHARITDRKLIIESGELWWDMDLEKVAKA